MSEEIRVLAQLGGEFERIALKHRRRGLVGGGRWRPLALVVVLCLGGTTAALAAAGVFRNGTPVGANVPANPDAFDGLAIPASVKLLSVSVPDPQGGPAWGLRYLRTTRGLVCLQFGRLVNGTIGALGQDGAFHDDGAFHAFSVNYEELSGLGCAELDAHGNAVFNAIAQRMPASAMSPSCLPTKQSPPPGFKPLALPVCPQRDLRDIYFGLLGPDATAVTYHATNGEQVTERTAGSDGAYVIVGSPTAQACAVAIHDGHALKVNGHVIHPCGNGWTSTAHVNAYGVISAVHYRSGQVCHMGPLGWCPPVGVSAIPQQRVTPAQVRSTITVSTSTGWRYCWKGRPASVIPCRGQPPRGYRPTPARPAVHIHHIFAAPTPPGGQTRLRASISFVSHVTIPNIDSDYEIFYWLRPSPATRHIPACQYGALDTASQSTHVDIRTGQRVTIPIYAQENCPGTMHGVVKYAAAAVSDSPIVLGQLGKGQATILRVGSFSFRVP
jgi:hypothetical protein